MLYIFGALYLEYIKKGFWNLFLNSDIWVFNGFESESFSDQTAEASSQQRKVWTQQHCQQRKAWTQQLSVNPELLSSDIWNLAWVAAFPWATTNLCFWSFCCEQSAELSLHHYYHHHIISIVAVISWSPNSTDLYFWYLFVYICLYMSICQHTNTKDIGNQVIW